GAYAESARLTIFAHVSAWRKLNWRMCFLHSPDVATVRRTSLRPLLAKEVWELLSGRALWTMLLLLCPLVGYSFFQAVALYGEASAAARDQPVPASRRLTVFSCPLSAPFMSLSRCCFHLLQSARLATRRKPAHSNFSSNCLIESQHLLRQSSRPSALLG